MEKSSLLSLNSRPILFVLLLATLVSTAACAKRSRNASHPNESQASAASLTPQRPRRININTAAANELETLPGIGKGFAQRIIEHREKYGPFRKPEHLIILRGISDKRFQALRELITVE